MTAPHVGALDVRNTLQEIHNSGVAAQVAAQSHIGIDSVVPRIGFLSGEAISALSLVPDVAWSFADGAGNTVGHIDATGHWYFGSVTTTLTGGAVNSATIDAPRFTNLTSLPFARGDSFGYGGLIPDLAWFLSDNAGNVGSYVDGSGGWHFGGLTATTATFTTLNVANFAPASIPFGTSALQTAPTLVPDFATVNTDGSGNVISGTRHSGTLVVKPSPAEVVKAIQPLVTRSMRMTQGAPTYEGSDVATSDGAGTRTYHLCCTLDSYFDAVRILLPCGTLTTSNTVKISVAPSAQINDYLNPIDSTGAAVAWTPVTFNNSGTDVDWFDQPFGAVNLPLSVATTGSDTVLNFASGVSAIEIGAPVYGRGVLAGTVVAATNPGGSPQTVTLSAALDTLNQNNQPIGSPYYFGKLTGTLQACPASQSIQITPSDWVGVSAFERSDVVGGWPILMVRVAVSGTPVPISALASGVLHSGWNNNIGDRIWSCYAQAGDFVTTPVGFAPGADNHKSMVFAVQFISRARGSFSLGVGDSVVQGVGGTLSGMGALALSHMWLSSLACPVTQLVIPNGWANNSGEPIVYYPTARALLTLLRPNVLACETWSRANFVSNLNFTQADADRQWQWNMMLWEKAATWGCQPLPFPAWPNSSMTLANDPIRVSSLTRSAEMGASGVMYFDGDAVVGTGAHPNVQRAPYLTDGLHLNAVGQNAYAQNITQLLRSSLGI